MRAGVLLILSVLLAGGGIMADEKQGERWLQKSGYGLMFHYEAFREHSAQSYNRAVDSFDVNGFVSAVKSTEARVHIDNEELR